MPFFYPELMNMPKNSPDRLYRLGALAANTAAAVTLAFCLLLPMVNADRGLDITDRSYYILWAGQPENVVGSVTHFGFLTGLLFQLTNGDIAVFRAAGLLILASFGLAFSRALHGYLQANCPRPASDLPFTPLAVASLAGSLLYYQTWLHVPSYNWLALIATLFTISGLLRLTGRTLAPHAGPVIIGVGWTTAWIAKPTTALMLAGLTTAWVLVHHRDRQGLRFLGYSILAALGVLFVFAWYFFGSPRAYLDNLRWGLEMSAALGGGHTLRQTLVRSSAQITTFLGWWVRSPLTWGFAALVGLGIGFSRFQAARPWIQHGPPLLAMAGFAYLAWTLLAGASSGIYFSTALLSVLGLLLLAATGRIVTGHDAPGLGIALFLAVTGLAPAFGTISDIVRRVSEYAVFPAAAIVILLHLLSPRGIRRFTPAAFALGLTILLALTLFQAYKHPYRLPAGIAAQKTGVPVGRGRLFLDEKSARYALELGKIARDAGWRPGTPLIDLTGGSPGAAVILDARIVGVPWLLGNYPGSNRFAAMALEPVARKLLARAWILTAPQGKRRLNPEILAAAGLPFPENYRRVGHTRTGQRQEEQIVWKPLTETFSP